MLEVQNITKEYADYRALDEVSLHVPAGKIFGLLGPNGAGKTSLIRIINQITAPDSGQIIFDGEKLNPKHVEQIGYLPEERGLYKKMKVGEQMIYLAQLKGLSKDDAKKRLNYWFEKMEVTDWWNKKIEDLSKGMQQKIQFIATVLHDPKLIILDEPFSGFDPVNTQAIQQEIRALNKQGTTIIYSTHRMETVEELCDHIALINKSKKILDGSVHAIKKQYATHSYIIDYRSENKLEPNSLFAIESDLENMDYKQLTIKINDAYSLNQAISYLLDKIEILQIKEITASIQGIFIDQVTRNKGENE